MKIKINIDTPAIKIEIEEENLETDIIEFLESITDFVEKSLKQFYEKRYKDHLSPKDTKVALEEEISESIYAEFCIRIAKDSKVEQDFINQLYDFGSKLDTPPLLVGFKPKSRSEAQRKGLLLILYANSVINKEDSISSKNLTSILTESNIDPTELNKSVKSENFEKFIKIDGKSYRITSPGIIEARKLINELYENRNNVLK